ncbi:MAG: hypothetical protein A2V77_15430 [Anaeromyxobacter sp. RBG_16_69_14]|nr:MAG: hypothetical protein A2V77_15430 [Anaeromyxobacter sp. RBG_16_69_14]
MRTVPMLFSCDSLCALYVSSHQCMSSPMVQPSGLSDKGASPSRCRSASSSFSRIWDFACALVSALVVTVCHLPAASLYLKRQPCLYP